MNAMAKARLAAAVVLILAANAQAAVRTWDGEGADESWSTPTNWSGDTVPVAGDWVIFTNASSKNCVITQNVSVGNFTMADGYTGAVSALANIAITCASNWYVNNSCAFDAGISTIKLTTAGIGDGFTPGTGLYYNLIIQMGWSSARMAISGTATVTEALSLTKGGITGGRINLAGDLTVGDGNLIGGTTILEFNGAEDQIVTSSGGTLPNVAVNKSGGTLWVSNNIVVCGNWTSTNGTVNMGTNDLTFANNYAGVPNTTFTPGNVAFYNLRVQLSTYNCVLTVSGTGIVSNNLILTTGTVNGGALHAGRNVVIGTASFGAGGTGFSGGSTALALNGAEDQAITNQGGNCLAMTIDKPAGVVYLSASLLTPKSVNLAAGTLDLNGNNLQLSAGVFSVTGGVVRLHGDETVTTPTLTNNSIVAYQGAAGTALVKQWPYETLTLDAPGKQFNWTAGAAYTVSKFLSIGGDTNQLVVLRSTVPGSQWYLDTTSATTTVWWADVQDSFATVRIRADRSQDRGHNQNWWFVNSGTTMRVW